MTWEGHPRTTTPSHRKNRALVLKRDRGICHVCGKPGADEVDHISPWHIETAAGRDPDRPSNLAPIHDDPCHRRKSSREGNDARWHRAPRRRPTETHPGIKGGG